MGGKGSGRPKLCPHCKEVLYCHSCGERYTPPAKDERVTKSLSLSKEVIEKIDMLAEAAGLTRSKYIDLILKGEVDPP